MKAALVFLLLALFVAAVYADGSCDPESDGKPNCVGNVGKTFRNFYDPTRYWLCETAGEPQSVLCKGEGYDPVTQACVPWSAWQWYPVCP